ncbi:hypothetical protein ABID95_005863 [Streptomyces atratus]
MDDHQRVPLSPAVLPLFPKPVRPWWKRPVVAVTVVLSAASFFVGGAIATFGDSSNAPPEPPQRRTQNDRPVPQSQSDRPAGVSPGQKFQILSKFCNQQAGGPYNVSESAYMECKNSFYVTDYGQVLPK